MFLLSIQRICGDDPEEECQDVNGQGTDHKMYRRGCGVKKMRVGSYETIEGIWDDWEAARANDCPGA